MQHEEEQEIIIRGSAEWWKYSFLHGGIFRLLVNGMENTLAIVGRALLLAFLVYCGLKAGMYLVASSITIPVWVDVFMFGAQIAGLEGSIPGLARLAREYRESKKTEEAEAIQWNMSAARWLSVLAAFEGVLHLVGADGTVLKWISGGLLLVRVYVITKFLAALAEVKDEGPRILSKENYDKEEQKRARQTAQAKQVTALQEELTQARQEMQKARSEQSATIQQLMEQIEQLKVTNQTTLASTRNQNDAMLTLQRQLESANSDTKKATFLLEQKRQEYDATLANLQSKERQITDLLSQIDALKSTKVDTPKATNDVTTTTKKAPKPDDKIANLDEWRAKHDDTPTARRERARAFAAAHPGMPQDDMAARLGISKRTLQRHLSDDNDATEESATISG